MEALARAVEGEARFHAAELEARTEAASWQRTRLAGASTPVGTVIETPPPAAPSDSSGVESPPPGRALASTPPAPDVETIIRDVIAQYISGLESRDLTALKRVWPSLDGNQERAIQKEFENARTVQAVFTEPRITVNGDTTTVTGVRMYSLVTQDGQRLSSVTRTTMTLRRNGEAWVIDRVVHQQ
jgi:hypothetical protein